VYNIALIPGDGIGPEIIGEGKKVIEAVSDKYGLKINWIKCKTGHFRKGDIIKSKILFRPVY